MNNYEMMKSRESLVEFQVLGAIVVQPWLHHRRRLWYYSFTITNEIPVDVLQMQQNAHMFLKYLYNLAFVTSEKTSRKLKKCAALTGWL